MDLKIKKNQRKRGFLLVITPILVAVMLILIQCDKGKESDNVVCTEEYMAIPLILKYPDGQPVLLDSSKVFWVSENRYLEQKLDLWNEARAWGSYLIVNDGMQNELLNKKELMRFTGYLNSKIVCERDMLVGADRCHVNYFGTEPLTQTIQYQ